MAFDREISAMTNFCEASSLSGLARRGVVHSQFNRLKDGRFGPSIAAICLKRSQFSEWLDDSADNRNLLRAATCGDDDPIMNDCLEAYDEALAGYPDPTNDATHYHDTSIDPPYWTVGATRTIQIDTLIFYKNVK